MSVLSSRAISRWVRETLLPFERVMTSDTTVEWASVP
jgi:hypothetical protein